MSYKEALQGNNIDLQSILDEINELPDRNNTATLKVTGLGIVFYLNSNGEISQLSPSNSPITVTDIIIPSILVSPTTSKIITGDILRYEDDNSIFLVYGDCTIALGTGGTN